MKFVGMANYFVDFEREVHASGDDGQPLRPRPLSPQAVAFSKPQSGIGNGDGADHGHVGGRDLVGSVQKFLRPMTAGIDVQREENMLRGSSKSTSRRIMTIKK